MVRPLSNCGSEATGLPKAASSGKLSGGCNTSAWRMVEKSPVDEMIVDGEMLK